MVRCLVRPHADPSLAGLAPNHGRFEPRYPRLLKRARSMGPLASSLFFSMGTPDSWPCARPGEYLMNAHPHQDSPSAFTTCRSPCIGCHDSRLGDRGPHPFCQGGHAEVGRSPDASRDRRVYWATLLWVIPGLPCLATLEVDAGERWRLSRRTPIPWLA
jgi:hypothetical protein